MPLLPRIHTRRLRQVVGVFYACSFGRWIRQLGLHFFIPIHKRFFMGWSRRTRELPCPVEEKYEEHMRALPVQLRLSLEKLGGVYLKLGQMLSLRADLVTQPVADELRQLQDCVPPFPSAQAKATVEKELGNPLKKLFKEFDEKPVGSASLAQVHRAQLPDGTMVAVKVLRPGIEELVSEDVLLLQWIARLLEEHVPAVRPYQPRKVVEEFADWTLRELNLLNEATNIAHFCALYEGEEGISIPAVFWEYTSRRVLTMEFSHGVPMDRFSEYGRLHSSRKKVAAIGSKLVYSQFFEHGFFHGDPHPGNFFVLPKNTVCLHDFGIVGRLDEETRRELIACFVDFLGKDAEGALRHLLHIARTDDQSDIAGFRREATVLLERWFYAPTAGERLSTTFYNMVIAGARHGVTFPTNVVLMAKAIVTMESMALLLDPQFEIAEALRPYLTSLMTMELRPSRVMKRAQEAMLDSANFLDELPEAARKIMDLAQREELGVKLDTKDFAAIKREIDRQSDIRFLTLFLVADLIATAVLLHFEGVQSVAGMRLSTMGIILAATLGILVLLRIRSRGR